MLVENVFCEETRGEKNVGEWNSDQFNINDLVIEKERSLASE